MLVTGAPASWFGIKVLTPRPRAVNEAAPMREHDDEAGGCGERDVVPETPDQQNENHLDEGDDQCIGRDRRHHGPGGKRRKTHSFSTTPSLASRRD